MSAKENRYAILGAWMLGEMGTAEGRGLASKKRKEERKEAEPCYREDNVW